MGLLPLLFPLRWSWAKAGVLGSVSTLSHVLLAMRSLFWLLLLRWHSPYAGVEESILAMRCASGRIVLVFVILSAA